jgi:hypothetical protein
MGDLFSNMPVRRTLSEMEDHIRAMTRTFPVADWPDVAEELIDRAERRGAIDSDTARALEAQFVIPSE